MIATVNSVQVHSPAQPKARVSPIETLQKTVSASRLNCWLDRVRAGGRIVDFKTSAKTPNAEDVIHQHETQLSCYSVLYREAANKRESARELHHLVQTETPKLIITSLEPMTELQQVRLFRMMDSYQEGLAREDFVPSPGLQCCGCEMFNECRRWA